VANKEHLTRLRRGAAEWNDWRRGNGQLPDLTDARLRDVDLSGANLTSANLSGANLRGAKLSSAALSNAELMLAYLTGANLRGARLNGADLIGADLCNADLSGADLTGGDLDSADLRGASLSGANLCDANLSEADLGGANLRNANLSDANLCDVNLSGADLSGANLGNANLRDADLSSADLSGADLPGANLRGADLSSANLNGADLRGANLRDANLSSANLSGVKLIEADLRQANLREANLSGAVLSETVLANNDLAGAVGLETCQHVGPSIIDFRTLAKSHPLPLEFLQGVGLPDKVIDYLPSLLSEPIQYYSCFISYSSKDDDFARRIHADLQSRGVRCWFAANDLIIGGKILDEIDAAIRLRDKVLLILSEHSIGSDWVEDEVKTAYEEERSRGQTMLFPVRLDDAVMETREAWATKLRADRNIGDFREWKTHDRYQEVFERVLRDLAAGPKKTG
jgi:uncharacterized protein YjbI with pentapeptide repeats